MNMLFLNRCASTNERLFGDFLISKVFQSTPNWCFLICRTLWILGNTLLKIFILMKSWSKKIFFFFSIILGFFFILYNIVQNDSVPHLQTNFDEWYSSLKQMFLFLFILFSFVRTTNSSTISANCHFITLWTPLRPGFITAF